MSTVIGDTLTITTNQAGLAEFAHGLDTKPVSVATSMIEDPAHPGPVAFLVTSWDATRITGLLMNRTTSRTVGDTRAEIRWEAEVTV